jgi:hypothetical protein
MQWASNFALAILRRELSNTGGALDWPGVQLECSARRGLLLTERRSDRRVCEFPDPGRRPASGEMHTVHLPPRQNELAIVW